MPPTLHSYLRRLAATAPAAAGGEPEALDTGVVLLIVVGALLLLAGSGCVFGYLNWHGKQEINTILFYHAEHHTLRGRDFYWVHMKGGHRAAYIYDHAFMEEHYPYALKVYHSVLRKGPLLDVEIGAEQREVLHTEMIKSNTNHGSHSEAMDHETIPKCFLEGLSTQRGDLEPALIFQRRAVLFKQLYQGEAFSHPNEGQDDWKHPPTDPQFDAPLLIAKDSSLSYQLGLKKGTNTIAWWVSTVRTHGYETNHFARGWNGMVDAPRAAGGNTSKKPRRLSSRQMMEQTYKNSLETTTEMVAMENKPVSDVAVQYMYTKAPPPPPLGTSRRYSFTGVKHILIEDDQMGADEHKNDTSFSSSSTSSSSTSSSSTSSSTVPPPPPEARAPPSEDVWYIIDDDPLKPYYQHSVSDKVLWSWQLDTVGDIRVIPFPDKEYAMQQKNETNSTPTTLKDTHTYIKSPPPPPPPLGSTRRFSYTGSKHVLFEDKDRNSRSLFQKQRKSRLKSAVQGSISRNSSGPKKKKIKSGNNVWYAILDDPSKPYYQHSITKEVVWSLAKARSEGEVIVVPFPE